MTANVHIARTIRVLIAVALLALPVVTAWNLIAAPLNPRLLAIIGQRLGGVTAQQKVEWSWRALRQGTLQKALTERVTEANPLRPLLIRSYNQLRASLFDELTAPVLARGHDRQLIETLYLDDYCGRELGMAEQRAREYVPLLQDLQSYYRARGGVFLFVVAPNKLGYMPEAFVGTQPCLSTVLARDELRPRYVKLLQQAGIEVIDTAALVYAQRYAHEVPLFPRNGAHWNDLGLAIATTAIVDKLNQVAGRTVAAPLQYSYTIDNHPLDRDNDLVTLQNQLFDPPPVPTPHVQYRPGADCRSFPGRDVEAAIVGGSFIRLSAEVMIRDACLSRLDFYFYLKLEREGGVPFRTLDRDLGPGQLARLRDAKILVLEENESFLGKSAHVRALHDIVVKP
jgi:hypothetical protein